MKTKEKQRLAITRFRLTAALSRDEQGAVIRAVIAVNPLISLAWARGARGYRARLSLASGRGES